MTNHAPARDEAATRTTAGERAWRVTRVDRHAGSSDATDDRLAVEEPMEIRIHDRPIAVVMRTPGRDHDLAAGFCVTEGILGPDDIGYLKHCSRIPADEPNNVVHVVPRVGVDIDFERLARHTFSASSCGICGKVTMASIFVDTPPLEDASSFPASVVTRLSDSLREAQALFSTTGGLHAAGLFAADGGLVEVAEDVGRHNAVDKVIGARATERRASRPCAGLAMMVSGRASFEIVQKALVAGVPLLVAVSAPSSMAVEMADVANITLVAFARGERFNIYTHGERIDLAS